MKKYIYCVTVPCHVVLKIKGENMHLSFYQDVIYDLSSCEKVKSLLAKGMITPIKHNKPTKQQDA